MMNHATYQIQVQGRISQRWTHWFDELTITVTDEEGASATTTLTGPVTDQAALLGLLQTLYTLGLPLLLVRRKEVDGIDDANHPQESQIVNDQLREENGGINYENRNI